MADSLDFLASVGAWSGEALWLPLVAWTLGALLVLVLDGLLPLRRPLVRQRMLVALLVALPLGIGLRLAYPLSLPEPAAPTVDFFVPESTPPAPATPLPAVTPSRPMLPLIGGMSVLLLGIAAMGGITWLIVQHVRLHRWLRRLPVSPASALSGHARVLIARLRLPSVRVRLVEAGVSPFTYGFFRPVVVLPARLAGDEAAAHLALAHEAAHIAHGDAFWHFAARLAAAFVPWHPLAWRLLRQAELRREQAADAYVLGQFPVARRQYAHLLLDFGAVPAPAAALAASVHQLKPRVAAMKNMLNLRARGIAPALLLLVSLSATLALRAQEASPPGGEVFVVVEEPPTMLPNNEVGMQNLQASIRYPNATVEGRVIVQFVVNEIGEVENPRIIRGIGAGADEEALRAVRELRFTPGRQRGEAVKVQMTLPITFRLAPPPPPVPGTPLPPPQPETPPPPPLPDGERAELLRQRIQELEERIREIEGQPAAVLNDLKEALQQLKDRLKSQQESGDGLAAEHTTVPLTDDGMSASPAPEGYHLSGMPNPSDGRTEIRFSVPTTGQARMEVYNAIGQRVAVLFDEMAASGQTYRVVFDGAAYESGVYFFRLTHNGHMLTHTSTLAR